MRKAPNELQLRWGPGCQHCWRICNRHTDWRSPWYDANHSGRRTNLRLGQASAIVAYFSDRGRLFQADRGRRIERRR